ncbi:hypothetical protein OH76DRAFT_1181546 [Lentinus brumalis]|uniref:Uncharacterized protein n=1 Tax=Lentinus brumalis TaxID=2498619 RepID=A0A371CTW6_9APHY|nr:hypothetical protein OH76DRAFT_1181546 [Polyporus brumalis]
MHVSSLCWALPGPYRRIVYRISRTRAALSQCPRSTLDTPTVTVRGYFNARSKRLASMRRGPGPGLTPTIALAPEARGLRPASHVSSVATSGGERASQLIKPSDHSALEARACVRWTPARGDSVVSCRACCGDWVCARSQARNCNTNLTCLGSASAK